MSRFIALLPSVLGLCLGFLPLNRPEGPPTQPRTTARPVTDVYHDTKVVDPYRWLENADAPEVRQWVWAQNRYTRHTLDQLPNRAMIRERMEELSEDSSPEYTYLSWTGGRLLAKSGDRLVALKSADDPSSETVLVDAEEIAPGKHAMIEFYAPSLDGKRVAVCISTEGRQEGIVHVYETAPVLKKLADVIPNVGHATMGGSVAWNADGSGFYYTRCPPYNDTLSPQHICFHKLGTPASEDTYSLGKKFSPLAGATLETSPDGRFMMATVQRGWVSGQTAVYLLGPSAEWTQLCAFGDRILRATFGPDQALYLLSYDNAPRGKILRLPLTIPHLKEAQVVVPQGEGIIYNYLPTARLLYVIELIEGSARLRVFDHKGTEQKAVPVRPLVSVEELTYLDGDQILFRTESYLGPPVWYHYDPALKVRIRTKITPSPSTDFSDVEVVREYTWSKDGTRVPLTIVRPKRLKKDGRNPVWLTGYGGYALTLTPNFDVARRVWLEQGGVYAVAHLRGDGDYGEEWTKDGMLTKRQNAFDDFAACIQHLIDKKYTSPDRLAIEGGSNGGLLVGAALTQYPEKFRAAVAWVGRYDVLRSESHPSGVTDVDELGTVKNGSHFKAMASYSPYHRVTDDKAYPAVLLVTGANDGRCNPADTWKMAARLQAATSSGRPVLVWTEPGAGHADARTQELEIDVYAFLFNQLGVKYQPNRKLASFSGEPKATAPQRLPSAPR